MRIMGIPRDLYIQCTAQRYAANCRSCESEGWALLDRRHRSYQHWKDLLNKAV
jgi:hypothetical protein